MQYDRQTEDTKSLQSILCHRVLALLSHKETKCLTYRPWRVKYEKPAGKLNSMDLMLKLVLQKTLEFLASMCSGDRDFLAGNYKSDIVIVSAFSRLI